MNEALTALLVYSISMLILWGSSHHDEKVSENWQKPLGIFLRMGVFHALLHSFLLTLPFATWESYLCIVAGLSMISIWSGVGSLIAIGIAWTIYQWAFWFPVKDEVILKSEPKKKQEKHKDLQGYGFASTDLKPIGKVMVEGTEYTALSTLGFIAAGEKVLIEGSNGIELRVRKDPNQS
ncbi:MAG: NfeD family protein [Opitutaceae bacterium]